MGSICRHGISQQDCPVCRLPIVEQPAFNKPVDPPRNLSRNQQFHKQYPSVYEDLKRQLYVTPHSARVGGWSGNSTRTRVRKLARQMTRQQLRRL